MHTNSGTKDKHAHTNELVHEIQSTHRQAKANTALRQRQNEIEREWKKGRESQQYLVVWTLTGSKNNKHLVPH